MYGTVSERGKRFRFLGISFDQKLCWREHIISGSGEYKGMPCGAATGS